MSTQMTKFERFDPEHDVFIDSAGSHLTRLEVCERFAADILGAAEQHGLNTDQGLRVFDHQIAEAEMRAEMLRFARARLVER